MLKIYYLSDYRFEEVEYNKISKLFELGHPKFKFNGDEDIIFKSKDQKEIEKYLGITMDTAEILKEYVENFDGGGYLQVTHHIQIGQNDCIIKMQESFEKYEDRIWESKNFREEILQIIQEQAYKVFLDIIKDGFETINNGNFKWR